MSEQKPATAASAACPELLTTRLARLGSRMREDENKVLIAEAVEALHAAEIAQSEMGSPTTESFADSYLRRVLTFVGARGDVDLETVLITSGYENPYRYSEYEGGGGNFAVNVQWMEKTPREDESPAAADEDGLSLPYAELTNEEVAKFLDCLENR